MRISDEVRAAVEAALRERFPDDFRDVEIVLSDDQEQLFVTVMLDPRGETFSGRLFGLTRKVRDALGDEFRDVFPVIRPVEAHA